MKVLYRGFAKRFCIENLYRDFTENFTEALYRYSTQRFCTMISHSNSTHILYRRFTQIFFINSTQRFDTEN